MQVKENLESHGILEFHFPGLESYGNKHLSWKVLENEVHCTIKFSSSCFCEWKENYWAINWIFFTFFVNKRLNLGHGKMFKGHGKGPGKCWNFKILKGYEPWWKRNWFIKMKWEILNWPCEMLVVSLWQTIQGGEQWYFWLLHAAKRVDILWTVWLYLYWLTIYTETEENLVNCCLFFFTLHS